MNGTDPKYPDGAPEWYKPYMKCEFSDNGGKWSKPEMAIFRGGVPEFQWISLYESGVYNIFKYARPVQPWTPRVGEEVIAWNNGASSIVISMVVQINPRDGYYLEDEGYYINVARLHNEDGSCIDVSGGIEAIKTRAPWV